MARGYSNDGKTYAITIGRNNETGKTLFSVHYDGDWYDTYEEHEVKYYDWCNRPHGNAPAGTPYGYFRATKNGKRIILTV